MLNQQSNKTNNSRSYLSYEETICESSSYSLDLEQIIKTIDVQFLKMYDRPLIRVEMFLLEGIWHGKTYSEIASDNHYSSTYITNVAAPKLFKRLSQLVRCRITKKSCFSLVTKYILENTSYRYVNLGSEDKGNERSLNKIYDSYCTFRQQLDFDRNSFLKDAVLFAQLN